MGVAEGVIEAVGELAGVLEAEDPGERVLVNEGDVVGEFDGVLDGVRDPEAVLVGPLYKQTPPVDPTETQLAPTGHPPLGGLLEPKSQTKTQEAPPSSTLL